MLKLHLLRHAKSSWQAPELDDHERDLNDRGRRDAPRMGLALAERFSSPPVIHCSSAVRAVRTLEGLAGAWNGLERQPHTIDDRLYTFAWEELLLWLQEEAEGSSCFLIGHNPGLTDLCNQLVGRRALDNLPTAGYLTLSLPVESFSDVTEGIARLDDYLFPKNLPG